MQSSMLTVRWSMIFSFVMEVMLQTSCNFIIIYSISIECHFYHGFAALVEWDHGDVFAVFYINSRMDARRRSMC